MSTYNGTVKVAEAIHKTACETHRLFGADSKGNMRGGGGGGGEPSAAGASTVGFPIAGSGTVGVYDDGATSAAASVAMGGGGGASSSPSSYLRYRRKHAFARDLASFRRNLQAVEERFESYCTDHLMNCNPHSTGRKTLEEPQPRLVPTGLGAAIQQLAQQVEAVMEEHHQTICNNNNLNAKNTGDGDDDDADDLNTTVPSPFTQLSDDEKAAFAESAQSLLSSSTPSQSVVLPMCRVEEYSRNPPDGKHGRTAEVLEKSVHYLFEYLIRAPRQQLQYSYTSKAGFCSDLHEHMWDRLRMMRKDWTRQVPMEHKYLHLANASSNGAAVPRDFLLRHHKESTASRARCLETMVRYTIYTAALNTRTKDQCEVFLIKKKLFMDAMDDCISFLGPYYRHERRARNAEMLSIVLFHNIMQIKKKVENASSFISVKDSPSAKGGKVFEHVMDEFSLQFSELAPYAEMAHATEIVSIVRLISAVREREFFKFFDLCRTPSACPLTALQRAFVVNTFSYVRFRAIIDLILKDNQPRTDHGNNSRIAGLFPIKELSQLLLFDSVEHCKIFIRGMGLSALIIEKRVADVKAMADATAAGFAPLMAEDGETPLEGEDIIDVLVLEPKEVDGHGIHPAYIYEYIGSSDITYDAAGRKSERSRKLDILLPPHRSFLNLPSMTPSRVVLQHVLIPLMGTGVLSPDVESLLFLNGTPLDATIRAKRQAVLDALVTAPFIQEEYLSLYDFEDVTAASHPVDLSLLVDPFMSNFTKGLSKAVTVVSDDNAGRPSSVSFDTIAPQLQEARVRYALWRAQSDGVNFNDYLCNANGNCNIDDEGDDDEGDNSNQINTDDVDENTAVDVLFASVPRSLLPITNLPRLHYGASDDGYESDASVETTVPIPTSVEMAAFARKAALMLAAGEEEQDDAEADGDDATCIVGGEEAVASASLLWRAGMTVAPSSAANATAAATGVAGSATADATTASLSSVGQVIGSVDAAILSAAGASSSSLGIGLSSELLKRLDAIASSATTNLTLEAPSSSVGVSLSLATSVTATATTASVDAPAVALQPPAPIPFTPMTAAERASLVVQVAAIPFVPPPTPTPPPTTADPQTVLLSAAVPLTSAALSAASDGDGAAAGASSAPACVSSSTTVLSTPVGLGPAAPISSPTSGNVGGAGRASGGGGGFTFTIGGFAAAAKASTGGGISTPVGQMGGAFPTTTSAPAAAIHPSTMSTTAGASASAAPLAAVEAIANKPCGFFSLTKEEAAALRRQQGGGADDGDDEAATRAQFESDLANARKDKVKGFFSSTTTMTMMGSSSGGGFGGSGFGNVTRDPLDGFGLPPAGGLPLPTATAVGTPASGGGGNKFFSFATNRTSSSNAITNANANAAVSALSDVGGSSTVAMALPPAVSNARPATTLACMELSSADNSTSNSAVLQTYGSATAGARGTTAASSSMVTGFGLQAALPDIANPSPLSLAGGMKGGGFSLGGVSAAASPTTAAPAVSGFSFGGFAAAATTTAATTTATAPQPKPSAAPTFGFSFPAAPSTSATAGAPTPSTAAASSVGGGFSFGGGFGAAKASTTIPTVEEGTSSSDDNDDGDEDSRPLSIDSNSAAASGADEEGDIEDEEVNSYGDGVEEGEEEVPATDEEEEQSLEEDERDSASSESSCEVISLDSTPSNSPPKEKTTTQTANVTRRRADALPTSSSDDEDADGDGVEIISLSSSDSIPANTTIVPSSKAVVESPATTPATTFSFAAAPPKAPPIVPFGFGGASSSSSSSAATATAATALPPTSFGLVATTLASSATATSNNKTTTTVTTTSTSSTTTTAAAATTTSAISSTSGGFGSGTSFGAAKPSTTFGAFGFGAKTKAVPADSTAAAPASANAAKTISAAGASFGLGGFGGASAAATAADADAMAKGKDDAAADAAADALAGKTKGTATGAAAAGIVVEGRPTLMSLITAAVPPITHQSMGEGKEKSEKEKSVAAQTREQRIAAHIASFPIAASASGGGIPSTSAAHWTDVGFRFLLKAAEEDAKTGPITVSSGSGARHWANHRHDGHVVASGQLTNSIKAVGDASSTIVDGKLNAAVSQQTTTAVRDLFSVIPPTASSSSSSSSFFAGASAVGGVGAVLPPPPETLFLVNRALREVMGPSLTDADEKEKRDGSAAAPSFSSSFASTNATSGAAFGSFNTTAKSSSGGTTTANSNASASVAPLVPSSAGGAVGAADGGSNGGGILLRNSQRKYVSSQEQQHVAKKKDDGFATATVGGFLDATVLQFGGGGGGGAPSALPPPPSASSAGNAAVVNANANVVVGNDDAPIAMGRRNRTAFGGSKAKRGRSEEGTEQQQQDADDQQPQHRGGGALGGARREKTPFGGGAAVLGSSSAVSSPSDESDADAPPPPPSSSTAPFAINAANTSLLSNKSAAAVGDITIGDISAIDFSFNTSVVVTPTTKTSATVTTSAAAGGFGAATTSSSSTFSASFFSSSSANQKPAAAAADTSAAAAKKSITIATTNTVANNSNTTSSNNAGDFSLIGDSSMLAGLQSFLKSSSSSPAKTKGEGAAEAAANVSVGFGIGGSSNPNVNASTNKSSSLDVTSSSSPSANSTAVLSGGAAAMGKSSCSSNTTTHRASIGDISAIPSAHSVSNSLVRSSNANTTSNNNNNNNAAVAAAAVNKSISFIMSDDEKNIIAINDTTANDDVSDVEDSSFCEDGGADDANVKSNASFFPTSSSSSCFETSFASAKGTAYSIGAGDGTMLMGKKKGDPSRRGAAVAGPLVTYQQLALPSCATAANTVATGPTGNNTKRKKYAFFAAALQQGQAAPTLAVLAFPTVPYSVSIIPNTLLTTAYAEDEEAVVAAASSSYAYNNTTRAVMDFTVFVVGSALHMDDGSSATNTDRRAAALLSSSAASATASTTAFGARLAQLKAARGAVGVIGTKQPRDVGPAVAVLSSTLAQKLSVVFSAAGLEGEEKVECRRMNSANSTALLRPFSSRMLAALPRLSPFASASIAPLCSLKVDLDGDERNVTNSGNGGQKSVSARCQSYLVDAGAAVTDGGADGCGIRLVSPAPSSSASSSPFTPTTVVVAVEGLDALLSSSSSSSAAISVVTLLKTHEVFVGLKHMFIAMLRGAMSRGSSNSNSVTPADYDDGDDGGDDALLLHMVEAARIPFIKGVLLVVSCPSSSSSFAVSTIDDVYMQLWDEAVASTASSQGQDSVDAMVSATVRSALLNAIPPLVVMPVASSTHAPLPTAAATAGTDMLAAVEVDVDTFSTCVLSSFKSLLIAMNA